MLLQPCYNTLFEMQAPALQHTSLASLNLRKHRSRHPRASRLIVSASQQSKSLLKLQIAVQGV